MYDLGMKLNEMVNEIQVWIIKNVYIVDFPNEEILLVHGSKMFKMDRILWFNFLDTWQRR